MVEIPKPKIDPFRVKKSTPKKEEPLAPTDLVENPYAALEDKADPKIPTASLQIYDFIGEYLNRAKDTHINRASSAINCHKRRWFQGQGIEGTPLTPRKIINFLLGDLAETAVLYFVTEALVGPGKLYSEVDLGEPISELRYQNQKILRYKQQDLTAKVGDLTVTAHVDGWGKRNADEKWELLECKSYSNYGFDDFKGIGPKDYLKQACVNLQTEKAKTLGATQVRFFGLRKETGHLWDRLHDFDPELFSEVVVEYAVASGKEEPKAPFFPVMETFRGKPTGRKILPFPCAGYCPFTERCHPNFEVEFKASQFGVFKPVYVFKECE